MEELEKGFTSWWGFVRGGAMAEHVQGAAAGRWLQASLGKVREHPRRGREGQNHDLSVVVADKTPQVMQRIEKLWWILVNIFINVNYKMCWNHSLLISHNL